MSDRSATTIMTTFSHPRDFTPCLRSSCNSGTCTRAARCACGLAIVRKRGRSRKGKNKWKCCQGQLRLSPQEQDGNPVISMIILWVVRWCPTPKAGPLFGVYMLDPQLLPRPYPFVAKGLLKKTCMCTHPHVCIHWKLVVTFCRSTGGDGGAQVSCDLYKLHLPAVGPLNLGAFM